MNTNLPVEATMQNSAAAKGGRSIGAAFFAVFGGAWLSWAYLIAGSPAPVIFVLILVVSLALFLTAIRQFRLNREAVRQRASDPRTKRVRRIFHFVNILQWALVIVAANVLDATGNMSWFAPATILIVGLHFIPLAVIMQYRWHYVTGAALVFHSIIFPFAAGPGSFAGPLGAGLILWIGALVALAGPSGATPQVLAH